MTKKSIFLTIFIIVVAVVFFSDQKTESYIECNPPNHCGAPPPPPPPCYCYEQIGYYYDYYPYEQMGYSYYSQGYYQGYYQSSYYSQSYYQGYYEGYYQGYYQSYYQNTYYSQSYYQGYYQSYYQGYYQGYYQSYYQAAYPPAAPSISSVVNSTCQRLTVNWGDVASETSYEVWRSTTNGAYPGASWSNVSGSLAANTTTYNDNSVAGNTSYYYRVVAVNGAGSTASSSNGPTLALECVANLTMTKSLSKVNGVNYTGATAIQAGDTLTFRIAIVNNGPANATVSYACDYPSSNIGSLRALAVTGTGSATTGAITYNTANCPNAYQFNLTGTKDIPNNWIVTFDATYNGTDQEALSNRMTMRYTDSQARTATSNTLNVITSPTDSKSPNFREVAP